VAQRTGRGEAGAEGGRLDDQHLDAEGGELGRQRLRQALQREPARRVGAAIREAHLPAHRGDHHRRTGSLGAQLRLRRLLDRADDAVARFVDEDVDAAVEEPGLFLAFPRRAAEAPKPRAFIEAARERLSPKIRAEASPGRARSRRP
jgi:hypothetical protein